MEINRINSQQILIFSKLHDMLVVECQKQFDDHIELNSFLGLKGLLHDQLYAKIRQMFLEIKIQLYANQQSNRSSRIRRYV